MGVETQIWVEVVVGRRKWVEVSAVTLDEAKAIAKRDEDVIYVLSATYDEPEELCSQP